MNPPIAILQSFLAAALAFAAPTAWTEGRSAQGPNWTGDEARAAIARVDTSAELAALWTLARTGDDVALLERVGWIDQRSDWPRPAREFVLFSLAATLADFEPGPGSQGVIRRLAETPSQVRVPHPDDERAGVVLFNIRAAAAGTANEWRRRAARDRANELIRDGAGAWIAAFVESDATARAGFIDAMPGFEPRDLSAIARGALPNAGQAEALAELGAHAALGLRDPELLARALKNPLPRRAALAREAASLLDGEQSQRLLLLMAASAPSPYTSVVLAELAPALLGRPEGVDTLAGLLAHPELGGAAALALARSTSPADRERLAEFGRAGHGWASQRALNAIAAEAGPEKDRP